MESHFWGSYLIVWGTLFIYFYHFQRTTILNRLNITRIELIIYWTILYFLHFFIFFCLLYFFILPFVLFLFFLAGLGKNVKYRLYIPIFLFLLFLYFYTRLIMNVFLFLGLDTQILLIVVPFIIAELHRNCGIQELLNVLIFTRFYVNKLILLIFCIF